MRDERLRDRQDLRERLRGQLLAAGRPPLDAKIEELCKIWDSGQWDPFYYSIFMEAPRKTVIQQETLDSEVRKKNR